MATSSSGRARYSGGTVDGLLTGGLMRCCTRSLSNTLYPNGPALLADDGQIFQCAHSQNTLHRMIFRSGYWRWFTHRPEDGKEHVCLCGDPWPCKDAGSEFIS